MTRSLSIPPEGPLMISDEQPHALAKNLLRTDMLSVITARALGRDRIYVMHIDDWGKTNGLPINRRAWAIYGGSPVYGLAVLSADDSGPIDDAIVELISAADFPPAEVLRAMDAWLETHS